MLDPETPVVLVRDDDLPLRPRSRDAAPARAAVEAPGMVGLVARLRASISDYARERRVAGASLDRVLAEVRDLARDAERAEGSPDELGVLAGRVARWATEAYLDEPEPRRVSRVY